MTPPPRFAWLNGEIVDWDRCVLHARSQGAFWGANVFEGLRAYWNPDREELSVFRLDDHVARLRRSMRCLRMEVAYSDAQIAGACLDLLRANGFREDLHLVVAAYFGPGPGYDSMGLTEDTGVHITALPRPRGDAWRRGIATSIASWRRLADDVLPPRIKSGANYGNNRLAHQEAVRNGYHTALILNQRGTLAESPGACVVMVREGALFTPPATSGALEGITLATVDQLARRGLGLAITAREIDRTELYVADEVFLCGTLAEILPVVSIDRLPIGPGVPGPLAGALQRAFDQVVRGDPAGQPWLSPVYGTEAHRNGVPAAAQAGPRAGGNVDD